MGVNDVPAERRFSAWMVAGVIALPFVIAVIALDGLRTTLPIFHTSDEFLYHYPTILRFSRELPFPDLGYYHSAQTPLFHVFMAYAGKIVGYRLWHLRFVEVLISYLLSLLVYHLLRHRVGLEQRAALPLTLLFVLSPYVYGTSFRVITDNLATLFIVLALERLDVFRRTQRLPVFAMASAAVGAAMLTRQSAAFMVPVAFLYAVIVLRTFRLRALATAVLFVACVPVGLLFLTWHGLVPPGGNPASCGLCSGGGGAGLVTRSPELALATIGMYGVTLFLPDLCRAAVRAVTVGPLCGAEARGALYGAVGGGVLLLVFPARPGSGGDAAGLIWSTAAHFPAIDGSSLVFWVLVPAAGAVLVWRLRASPRAWPVIVFAGCFVLGTLAIRLSWQKYVDPFALLTVLLTVRPGELGSPRALLGALVLAVAFIAYVVDTGSHADTDQYGALRGPGATLVARVEPYTQGHGFRASDPRWQCADRCRGTGRGPDDDQDGDGESP